MNNGATQNDLEAYFKYKELSASDISLIMYSAQLFSQLFAEEGCTSETACKELMQERYGLVLEDEKDSNQDAVKDLDQDAVNIIYKYRDRLNDARRSTVKVGKPLMVCGGLMMGTSLVLSIVGGSSIHWGILFAGMMIGMVLLFIGAYKNSREKY